MTLQYRIFKERKSVSWYCAVCDVCPVLLLRGAVECEGMINHSMDLNRKQFVPLTFETMPSLLLNTKSNRVKLTDWLLTSLASPGCAFTGQLLT